MKRLSSLILISSILITMNDSFAQNERTPEVQEIIDLGRDSIIKLALNKVKDLYPNTNVEQRNFDKIDVYANSNDLYVSFQNQVLFLRKGDLFLQGPLVSIVKGSSGGGFIAFDPKVIETITDQKEQELSFYEYTPEVKYHLDRVEEAILKAQPSFKMEDIGDNMEIKEYNSYYQVWVYGKYMGSDYKIDKETLQIYDESHEHYVEDNSDAINDDPFVEIKN